jgi:glycosyltransferase involved in cell wall biosynthesis
MSQTKKKVLIFIDWFLPGIKAGGPIKSVSAIVNQLSSEFDFYVLTTDTDFGEQQPYQGIESNKWIDYKSKAKVCYLSKSHLNPQVIEKHIRDIAPDTIYINSFYSKFFSIIPLKVIKMIGFGGRVVLAPRGMLSKGALRIKPLKKKLFIAYSKFASLHKNVVWHSTKPDETIDIKNVIGNVEVVEIQNLPDVNLLQPSIRRTKEKNELRLIYLGRIAENKNLSLVLSALSEIKAGHVKLDIFGSIEDKSYWAKCEAIIKTLSSNIEVNYKGMLDSELVQETISNYHYLILLSYSENYGHAIVESFSCGTPVIISNTTPWKNLLGVNAGWDVEINSTSSTVNALQTAIALTNEDYQKQSIAAYQYAEKHCFDKHLIKKFKELF